MAQGALLTIGSLSYAMGSSEVEAVEQSFTVESAIERSTVRLESLMYTPLRAFSCHDLFMVSDRAGEPLDGYYRLLLSAGNLHEEPQVLYGTTPEPTDAVAGHLVDMAKGVIRVPAEYLGKFVKVVYRSGFLSASEVPPTIKQALICLTPIALLAASGNSIESKVLLPALNKATNLENQGLQIASGSDRRVGAALKAMNTSMTPVSAW